MNKMKLNSFKQKWHYSVIEGNFVQSAYQVLVSESWEGKKKFMILAQRHSKFIIYLWGLTRISTGFPRLDGELQKS